MAKEKVKGAKGVPNKHLHARVAYLQHAAILLARQCCASDGRNPPNDSNLHQQAPPDQASADMASAGSSGLPQYLASHLRQVALKAQIRLDSEVKRGICKTCNAVLIDGETCLTSTENLSRGARKPHADMLVLECMACGTKKRFPTAAARQRKKGERKQTVPTDTEKVVVPSPK